MVDTVNKAKEHGFLEILSCIDCC